MQAEGNRPTGAGAAPDELDTLVRAEQLRAHYAQLPSMAIAQTAGAFFTAWVLWDAVDNRALVVGLGVVALLSLTRLWLHRRYTRQAAESRGATRWRVIAVAGALTSGCVWGSAAPFLYPPQQPEYTVYLVALLTLLPIVPVAALAAYLPAFHAYVLPCLAPFIVTLALRPSRAEHFAALLLVMMLLAMLAFARRYSRTLADAIALRLRLARQSDALQAAIEHRTRFIAAASHDLRQPVHAMGLFLATLRAGDGQLAGALAQLEASQRSLRAMIDNLLDMSRLEAKVVAPSLREVALGPLLRQLEREFAPQAQAKGLRFRCRPGNAVVTSDPALLERMLRNLLSNALKFTECGGVLLACRRGGAGRVLLQVYDTGAGIAAESAAAAFDAHPNPTPRTPGSDGLGLGLAIVRQNADLLGHALLLRSANGRGSMFGIALACAPAQARTGEGAALVEPPRLPPAVVMVIDDHTAVREGTAALLREWGLQVAAGASFDALPGGTAPAARVPDLLLADERLAGGESGLAGVQRLRRRWQRDVPVILVSADTAPQRIRQAHEAGCVLLHKPVDPAVLRACVSEALARRQATAPGLGGTQGPR